MAKTPTTDIQDSKILVNYRYPEACCGRCIHAFQNEYGDYQCNILAPGNTIDLGAVCDKYQEDKR
jgi:hypothetical protein